MSPHLLRALDPRMDWAFFDPDFEVPAGLRAQIQPLTEAGAAEVWRRHVSAMPTERHPMLLPADHWLTSDPAGPEWTTGFNEATSPAAAEAGHFSAFLRESLRLDSSQPVLFIAMRERGYQLPFGVFLSCWPCFLATDDEGSFLFHPESGAFACFGPRGSVSLGRREPDAR